MAWLKERNFITGNHEPIEKGAIVSADSSGFPHFQPNQSGIGEKFDKKEWQRTLEEARVNSITLFFKCHHGWSYHPTTTWAKSIPT